jgi:hypothetical protein
MNATDIAARLVAMTTPLPGAAASVAAWWTARLALSRVR